MQLSLSFSFLLTTLLFTLAQVEAFPTKRSPRTVTLPLKRLSQPSDVHPSNLLQRSINHARRRHARMAGREGPSTTELERPIKKRLHIAKLPPNHKRSNAKISGLSFESVYNQGPDPKDGFPEMGLDPLISGDLTKANKPTADNSLGLDILGHDAAYIATVQVGTPPRDYSILMDSGSADFWIGGEGCHTNGTDSGCGNHAFLGSNSSSTFQDTGKGWWALYGIGAAWGNVVTDNVNIAGLALNKHTFGVAYVETEDFSNNTAKFDGIMGLARSTISNQSVPTPVESLAQQGLISEAITSYKLSRVSDGLNDGEITFGGLDSSKFDPKTLVTFQNANKYGYWGAPFTVSIGGEDLRLQGRTAILDTGTTLIYAPEEDVKAIHAKIPGWLVDYRGNYIIPCTNTAVVSLTFGGRAFDINPIDLLFAPVDPNNLKGDCYSAIASGSGFEPETWLVGDVFLRNVYFSHNVDKNEISLAKLV